MPDRTVLISGAGIAGPALAYWLLRHDFTPTIVERAPAPRTGGYMIDFWGVGYDVAERMGLLPALQEDGYRIEEVRIVNAAGKRLAYLDAGIFGAASGGRFLSIPRGDLAHRIYELVDGRAETIFADSITALTEDDTGVTATFEHAVPRRFDLVVGADGLHSTVRQLAFGDGACHEHFLGYYTAAFTAHDYPRRDEGVYLSYSVPGGQAARYALRDGRSAFFFMFARDEPLALGHHDVAAQKATLRTMFTGAGWECDEILAAMERTDDLYFDAVAQMRLPHWSRGRVALVGDAAYCPSLLAGQGSAFAMAGAYVLAHALAESGDDYTAAFAEYERRFKPFIDAKQRAAARFGWWFAPRSALGIRARNLLTNLMRVPVLAERVVARSFGDRFELPG
jgi:2-polyprenyl-6-methoxyphenol hydroxylase-like FAD-dependent oxidoreductase